MVALAWEDIGREEARETMSDSEYFFWQLGHPGESPSEEELAAEIEKLSKASWMTPENIESYARQRRIGIERPALDI